MFATNIWDWLLAIPGRATQQLCRRCHCMKMCSTPPAAQVPSLMSAFEELGICPEIIQAVEEDDWLLPTPVQQEAIPLILGGGDVLVAAETGSGKTGAFGLPCLQIVHETLRGKCSTRKTAASNLKCELNLNDKDMFVLVTEDGLECKSEDDKRWNGTLPQSTEKNV
ncbi:ddx1 [Symbiodinium sp. CCMP2592]|nr:ddx1 [Symbiodinium sp. CCMP2592]